MCNESCRILRGLTGNYAFLTSSWFLVCRRSHSDVCELWLKSWEGFDTFSGRRDSCFHNLSSLESFRVLEPVDYCRRMKLMQTLWGDMEHVEVKYITNSDITQRQKIEVCSRDISEIFKREWRIPPPHPITEGMQSYCRKPGNSRKAKN